MDAEMVTAISAAVVSVGTFILSQYNKMTQKYRDKMNDMKLERYRNLVNRKILCKRRTDISSCFFISFKNDFIVFMYIIFDFNITIFLRATVFPSIWNPKNLTGKVFVKFFCYSSFSDIIITQPKHLLHSRHSIL